MSQIESKQSMSIAQLFQDAGISMALPEAIATCSIRGLSADSRYCQRGDLFFARAGKESHGLDYIEAVMEAGAAAVIYEGEWKTPLPEGILTLRLDEQSRYMNRLVTAFYGEAIASLALIGVTGTEGKTSVTQFVAQALTHLHYRCGVIGTNGMGFLPDLIENAHTTPDQLTLYHCLSELQKLMDRKDDLQPVALEVTSHALAQSRVAGLSFAVTALTNLSRDHLDYHGSVAAYGEAKRQLFTQYTSAASVLNIEDSLGISLYNQLREAADQRQLYPYGESPHIDPHYLQICKVDLAHDGLRFTVCYQGESYEIESSLYGRFNAYNLTATIGILLGLGFEMDAIIPAISAITNVRGRMERVELSNGAVGIVDYAHKPNALLQALQSLRAHLKSGRLMVIFGCGGDRDRGKRPIMAEIAEAHADRVIVTSDNPRTEDPEHIIDEIMSGFKAPKSDRIVRISDRRQAIEYAYSHSNAGDIILIAGKGHEDYQIIGRETIHFSDLGELERLNGASV